MSNFPCGQELGCKMYKDERCDGRVMLHPDSKEYVICDNGKQCGYTTSLNLEINNNEDIYSKLSMIESQIKQSGVGRL